MIISFPPSRGEPAGYRESLALAVSNSARSIAFPSISTGAFGFPIQAASSIAVRESRPFLSAQSTFEAIVLVAFDEEDAVALRKALSAISFPGQGV